MATNTMNISGPISVIWLYVGSLEGRRWLVRICG